MKQIPDNSIVDNLPQAIIVLGEENQVTYLNPAAERLYGIKSGGAVGQPLEKISPPLAQVLQDSADSDLAIVEYQIEERGKVQFFEIQVSQLANQQGQKDGWLLTINDVTEQRSRIIKQSGLERFRILFERSPDGVVLIDPHSSDVSWRIIDCNPAFCQMNGYTYKELVGQSIDIIHREPDPLIHRDEFFQRLKTEETVTGTVTRCRKDESTYHAEFVISLFNIGDRDLLLGIDHDITNRIQSEEVLLQHVRQLELINQVSREIAAELSLDILLPKAAELIQESFGYPHVGLFLLDSKHEELVMKARTGAYAELFPPEHRLKLSEGINGWVAQNGERLLIGDVRTDPRYYNAFPEQLILSELSVPIKWGEEVVGVLDIQSDQLDAFDKSDVLVLETLADQLATAIQNAELFEQTQQVLEDLMMAERTARSERDRAQQYLDVAGTIIVALDEDAQVTMINRKGCKILGYESQELVGQNWFNIAILEDEQQRIKQDFQRLLDGEADLMERAENAIVTRQGEERIIEWQNTLLRDDDGEIIGTLSSGIDITERQRAEQALRESEEQYRSVTEQSLAGVYIYQDGKFRYVNSAVVNLTGYTYDEIVDKLALEDLIHPDDLAMVEENSRLRIEGKTRVDHYTFQSIRKTGEIVHCEVLPRLVTYQGRTAIIGTILDVTERVRAEQALRESEEQYRSVTEQSLAGFSIYQDDKFRYVNTTFALMLGYSRDEIVDKLSIDDIIHPDDLSTVRESMRSRFEGRTNVDHYTFRAIRKTGDTIHCEVLGRIATYQGRPAVLGTLLDITGRIKVEQALRESEEQYRSVTEQNLAGVYVIQDHKFCYVNPALARIFGYQSADQIINQLELKDIIYSEDLPLVMEKIRQRLEGEVRAVQYTLRVQRPSGEIIYCEAFGRVGTYQGRPAILGTMLDVTERIQVEQAMLQHASQLELINQVSREITAELSLDILLPKAAELIQESFGYPHVGLFLLDAKHKELMMKARAGAYAELFPPDHRLKLSEGINGWVARNGERLLIGDVRTDPRYYNAFPEQLVLSELSVPIRWGEEVVGVLDIQSDQLNAFDKNDVLVLETLADQLATAIQNADLFDQAQRILDELVKAEVAVRGERDRAQQYLDVVGVIMVALNQDGRITLINRKGCEILGYEPSELIGQNWFNIAISEQKRTQIKDIFGKLMSGESEQLERMENEIVTRQGEARIIEWRNALLRNDAGKIIGTLSSGNDVTERRRAEEHERDQRILAEVLRDNAAIINSTLDLDSVLVRVLDNVVRAVAFDAADILLVQDGVAHIKRCKGYEDYVTEEEIQAIELPLDRTPNLRQMVKTQQPVIIPDISKVKDWTYSSTYAWACGYIGAPIIFNDQIIGFVSIYSTQPNVYDSSNAERLQAFADQAAIAIRNAQLFEQMNRYAAELEDSNERLAAYGHTIAHDLKNPLSTLLMGFEIIMAEGDKLSPTGNKFARQSQELVKTMSRTIDGLLRLAELREDQGEIEPVDMNMVIENVLARLMKLIMDRGVRFEIEPDLPGAMGYDPWIQEVLANLISNGVKYIGKDNPDPLIILRGRIEGEMVRYEVEDNGVGISLEDQGKLFEAFSRFHKSEASGHGLGLSIVKSIVHKLDGELGVESTLGEGSIFWFTLPALPSQ